MGSMTDRDFEKLMDTWADQEAASAPQLRPTAAMYRMVRARGKRKPLLRLSLRWAALGAAVVCLLVVAVTLTVVRLPSDGIAAVGLREGFASERGIIIRGPAATPGKGPRRGPLFFGELMFQFHRPGSEFVEGVDLRIARQEAVALTSADNYRLFLEPAQDCYVYLFQRTASDALVRLFPDETYGPLQNPLRQGQPYYVPAEPHWFYLEGKPGDEHLYVVASTQPLQDLEGLYARYSQADESDRREILSRLLEMLETAAEAHGEGSAGWAFAFQHQR